MPFLIPHHRTRRAAPGLRRRLRWLLLPGLLSIGTVTGAPAPGIRIDRGEIDGAKYTVARPAHWNRFLLLFAHGYAEDPAPLVAELNPEHLSYRTLLAEGWMVAATSYRRNGMIIKDGIQDLENLRAHIAKHYGDPERTILEGDSMGGAIVTLMAEQFPEHYQGVVAVDAAFEAHEPNGSLAFNLQPQIPVVFLANRSELGGAQQYVKAPFDRPARPALLEVNRDGHVNVNERERLAAIHAVLALIDRQPIRLPGLPAGPAFFDATQEPNPGPSQVRLLNEGGFEARVTEVSSGLGNLVLNAQPLDFAQADIAPGIWFALTAKGRTFRVRYARDFSSVRRGQWVAFPNADGFFNVARNFANAATSAGLKAGDPVVIHRLVPTAAPE